MVLNVLIFVVVLVCLYNFHYKRQVLPPGPTPLPFIGNILPLLDAKQHVRTLLNWREKFGTVYTLWLGEEPIITVNDHETAERWFVQESDVFCNRFMSEYVLKEGRNNSGILSTSGQLWKEHRRFALKALRDCLGQSKMQEKIMEEVDCVIEKLHNADKNGVLEHNFIRHFDLSTSSFMNFVVFGQRLTIDNREAELDELKELSNALMKTVTNPVKLGFINNEFIRKIPFLHKLSAELIKIFNDINQIIDRKIEESKKQSDEIDCYVRAFLQEKVELDKNEKTHTYSHLQLRGCCLDLLIAGSETTSATLGWSIAYLILNQDVQTKIHEELDRVVGRAQQVTVNHRPNLPYLNAVIVECQRCANILLQNLIRRVSRDTTIDGFYLKKGQAVIPQISVMLSDPKVFPEPEKFKPERFLNKNGHLVGTEKVLAFSLGKRQCIGEGLAKLELFLFIANIMSQFKVLPANQRPRLERQNNGTASTILPYLAKIERRF